MNNVTTLKEENKRLKERLAEYEQSDAPDAFFKAHHHVVSGGWPAILWKLDAEEPFDALAVSCNISRFGYTQVSFHARELRRKDIIHDEDYERVLNELKRLREKRGSNIELDFRIRSVTGEIKWVSEFFVPKYGDDAAGFFTVMLEITDRITIEKELRDSLMKSHILFDAFPTGITLSDDKGKIIESNALSEELLGISKKAAGQRHLDSPEWEIVTAAGDPYPHSQYPSVRALRQKEIIRNERMGIKKPDGSITWLNVSAAPMPVEGYGSVVTYEDVSKLYEKERRLEEMHALFSSIFHQTHDPMVIADETGSVLEANQAFYDHFRMKPSAVLGRKTHTLLKGKDKERLVEIKERFDRDGVVKRAPVRLYRSDGVLLSGLLSLRRMEVEGKVRFVETYHDLAFDSEARKNAAESNRKYETLFNAVSDGVVVVNEEDMSMLEANPAFLEMFGYSEAELTGLKITDLHREEMKEKVVAFFRDISEASGITTVNVPCVTKSGDLIYCDITQAVARIERQKIRVGVFRDVSVRLEQQGKLREAMENAEKLSSLKSNFIATISHELRTPMNGILGMAQILEMEVEHDEELSGMVQRILASGQRLNQTLESMLDFSMLESEDIPLNREKVDIGTFVQKRVENFRYLAESRGLDFTLELPGKPLYVEADQRMLGQTVNNLIDNALKFTSKGGVKISVTAGLEQQEEFAFIAVHDTGIGIKPEHKKHIFDAFRQGSEGSTRRYEGTGLGLSIAYKVVTLLGGDLSVESEPGEGATFRIKLPAILPMAEKAAAAGLKDQPPKLLLVEDNEINREVADIFLSDLYTLHVTVNGEDAVETAAKEKFDAVLMDINLGSGISGIEATRRIKALPGYEDVPMIAVTGYSLMGDREKLFSEGLTHYISKPFDKDELLEVIEKAIGK